MCHATLLRTEGHGTLDSGYKKGLTDSSYLTINCLFNDTNYWLNLSGRALKRTGRTLDLSNQRVWLKLVQDLYKPKANGATKVRTECNFYKINITVNIYVT